jgi:Asp-tRNA(Asn)/Glu-tRNA(Gln) amidotransferase A subunit family amidase
MAPPKRRLPSISTNRLRVVAAALEHPRVHALLSAPLRLARKRLEPSALDELPARPPLPPPRAEASPATDAADAAELLRARPTSSGTARGLPSIADFAAAYAARRATPVEVAEAIFAAVAESERGASPMRFFISLDEDDVRAQAEASAARHRAGRPLSLLDGVPVAVKDEIDQAGYVTTLGTRMPGMRRARRDCVSVARLRAQGALLLGKANMHTLGAGPTGFNDTWGTARNPWNPAQFPGGSSSGSAALVAAGLAPLAVGCDGGGSIRIPASLCGAVGLKATFARIPKVGETPPIAHSITHIGPIGRTVHDVALGYAAMAGPLRGEEGAGLVDGDVGMDTPPASLAGWDRADLRGLTLGVVERWWADASREVSRACERTLGVLEACGARLIDVAVDGLDEVRDVLVATIGAEIQHNPWFLDLEARRALPPDIRVGLAIARHIGRAEYAAAQGVRRELTASMWQLLARVDALVAPSTLSTAPPIPPGEIGVADVAQIIELMRTCALANLTGQPAISFCAGFDGGGLPIGFQAIGRPWEEATLLRIARAGERAHERLPMRAWRVLPG